MRPRGALPTRTSMETPILSRWERLFEAIHELSALISAGPHREELILERILRSSRDLLQARFVHLFLVEEDRIRRFVLSLRDRQDEALRVHTLPRSENLVKWIQQEQAAALLPRLEGLAPPWSGADDPGVPLRAPLRTGNRTHGVLLVFPRDEIYGAEDEKLLCYLANQAAVVLEHARLYRKLEAEATTDGLTGLYNYRYYMEAVGRELKRAERFGEPFSVVMVDVDNLKEYNDRNGHLAGSSALKEMGEILRADAREIDIIAKYGGDEFSLLLPNTSMTGSLVFAERMLRRVHEHHFQGDPARRLTVSAGIAVYPEDGEDARILLQRADARLYQAKGSGRNRIGAPDRLPPTSSQEI